LRLARSQRAALLRGRDNFLKDHEKPRHHCCLGKRYVRAPCKGTSISLKRCHKACSLHHDAKAEFLAATWEVQRAKAESKKLFNEGLAIEQALAPKNEAAQEQKEHPLRRRSLKLVEKARRLAEIQKVKALPQEQGRPQNEIAHEIQEEEVVLSRA
jgi:hypothetical protein